MKRASGQRGLRIRPKSKINICFFSSQLIANICGSRRPAGRRRQWQAAEQQALRTKAVEVVDNQAGITMQYLLIVQLIARNSLSMPS